MQSEFGLMEKKWQNYWKKNGTYAFSRSAKLPVFSVDTPPPTVSGRMHLGHAFSYTQADMVCRFKRMQGNAVFYPFGFDDNGLATERMVEKNLGIRAKDFSREKFIEMCLAETRRTEELLESDFRAIGLSVDWNTLYRTISKEARRAAQLSFIDIFEKDRAELRLAPTMWCTKCETAIAQAELEDEKKPSALVFIKMDLAGNSKKSVTIATTRPEMLAACVGVHVHPDDKRYKEFVGKKLVLPLFAREVPVIANKDVKMEYGSGAVYHCTYGGQQDIEFSLAFKVTPIEILGKNGKLNENAGEFVGLNVLDARKKIVETLKEKGHVEKIEQLEHVTNVHERCKTPIEILTSRQWFVRYLDLKEKFLQKAREINWAPEHTRHRMENWVNGLKWDWNISRQRFFGVPFPVWYCKKCKSTVLAERKHLPVDPLSDKPQKKCSCGSAEFDAEKDVFDTWFTSSLSPQISLGWAEQDKLFEQNFPMDLRVQAHDIINLWAFYTIVKAHLHEGKIPWKNIMISGHALDAKGRKMSKSLGNVVEPLQVIEKYSADILRYWAATAALGDDLAFQEKDLIAGKKFMQKLLNASAFVAKASEGLNVKKLEAKKMKFRANDKWLLQRLNQTIEESTKALEEFEFSKGFLAARSFFWLEFADFYLEEAKYRVYGNDLESKEACVFALNETMFGLLKLFAPFFPHIAEEIAHTHFAGFLQTKSIHLEKWPALVQTGQDKQALVLGRQLMEIIAAVRKEKTTRQFSLNKEMEKIVVYGQAELKEVGLEIEKTMNVKVVEFKKGKGQIEASKEVSLDLFF